MGQTDGNGTGSMGRFTTLKTNHGISISKNDVSIDVIVRKIAGEGREREAEFEIRGIPGLVILQLKSSDGIFKLNHEIEIGIRQVSPGKGKRVPIHIRAPSTYRVKDNKYY